MQYWKTYLSKLLKFAVLSKSVDKDSSEFTSEDWDEISIGKGACVELQNVNGVWYILSSDGIKMD